MALSIKPGVDFTNIHSRIVEALPLLEKVWARFGQDLVITSGREGNHMRNSLHYKGRAIDCRTRYFLPITWVDIHREAQEAVGGDFNVVWEKDHMHLEFDP